jgi:hypothetical protein
MAAGRALEALQVGDRFASLGNAAQVLLGLTGEKLAHEASGPVMAVAWLRPRGQPSEAPSASTSA